MHKRQILSLSCCLALGIIFPGKTVLAQTTTNLSDTTGSQTSSPNVSIDTFNGNGIPNVVTVDPNTGTITGTGIDVPITFGSSSGGGTGTGSALGTGTGTGTGTGSAGSNETATGSSSGTGASMGQTKPGEVIPSGDVTGNASGDTGTVDSQTPNTAEDSAGGNSIASEKGECLTAACLEASGEAQELTINDVAELLESNLDDSIDTLTAIESGSSEGGGVARTNQPQEDSPRRIARNNNTRRNVLGGEPRRIARQNSPHGCGRSCVNPDIPTVEARNVELQEREAREVVERQLAETQKFIEQVNNIDPENNIW